MTRYPAQAPATGPHVAQSTTYRRYMARCGVIFTLLAATSIGFCYIVDPYRLYPPVFGLSAGKSVDLFYHLRLHKPYAIYDIRPRHIIVGSSVSARLPPRGLSGADEIAYNASLPGVSLWELRRFVEHAHRVSALKTVIIGLEYYMFQSGRAALDSYNADRRLLKPSPTHADNWRHGYQRIKDYWSSLLSVDALLDAYTVAFRGNNTSQRIYHDNGTWDANIPTQRRGSWAYSMLSRQKFTEFSKSSEDLRTAEFISLLDFCKSEGIDATVILSPMHALTMNAIRLSGKWDNYLNWLRAVVEITGRYSSNTRLLGFGDNRTLVYEPLTQVDPLFRDGAHYTASAGSKFMACIESQCGPGTGRTILSDGSIEGYLHRVEKLMLDYPLLHRPEYEALLQWLEPLRRPAVN